MSDRFFVEEPITGSSATLVGQEAQHLLKVLRATVGDEITLFDGSGDEFLAKVARCSRSEVGVEIVRRETIDRELAFAITMGVALPKGDRQRWLIEKLTELGVKHLVPLRTARGVAQPSDQALVRLQRFVIEASKQCGRNRLMTIGEPRSCAEWVHDIPPTQLRVVAHPSADQVMQVGSGHDVAVAIGPEGGFTDDEMQQFTGGGWQALSFGPRILRIETAAIVAAALAASSP